MLAHMGYTNDPWTYRFFFSELHLFLLGILAYRVYKIIRTREIRRNILYTILFTNVLMLLMCDVLRDTFLGYFTDVLYICMIFFSVPFLFYLSKDWKFDSRLGELSYPIYISHMFMISLIGYFYKTHSVEYWGWIIVIATICFSLLLNKIIGYPIDKYRQGRVSHK